MAKKKELSFDQAFEQLQDIVEELKDEEIGIDQLSDKITKAKTLIEFTKTKLRTVEEDVMSIIEKE